MRQEDLEFCWQKALGGDPWFRLHLSFAPKRLAPQLLALHSLFAMLDRALNMSDESLIPPQLGWWQSELSPERVAASAHPVLRALRETGALERLAPEHLQAIVVQALAQFQAETISNREELKALSARVGEARVLSEAALGGDRAEVSVLKERCAGTGLSSMINRALRVERAVARLIPLELHARHGVDRREISGDRGPATQALGSLVEWAESWFDDQAEALGQAVAAGHCDPGISRHLLAMTYSERLRLVRSVGSVEEGGSGHPGRWGPVDFLRVWRDCRRSSRRGASNGK